MFGLAGIRRGLVTLGVAYLCASYLIAASNEETTRKFEKEIEACEVTSIPKVLHEYLIEFFEKPDDRDGQEAGFVWAAMRVYERKIGTPLTAQIVLDVLKEFDDEKSFTAICVAWVGSEAYKKLNESERDILYSRIEKDYLFREMSLYCYIYGPLQTLRNALLFDHAKNVELMEEIKGKGDSPDALLARAKIIEKRSQTLSVEIARTIKRARNQRKSDDPDAKLYMISISILGKISGYNIDVCNLYIQALEEGCKDTTLSIDYRSKLVSYLLNSDKGLESSLSIKVPMFNTPEHRKMVKQLADEEQDPRTKKVFELRLEQAEKDALK